MTSKTYELFSAGLTDGVFQFESSGMKDILRKFKPSSVEHLTALNALYRPGPIGGGMIDDFIKRKHGVKKSRIRTAGIEDRPQETYGVIVYQEQVMQIANIIAGYSLGEADLLRRAMGKKKAEEMAAQREKFVERRARQGLQRREEDHPHLRSDGAVRRLRLQQVAFGGVRRAGVSHGLSEGEASAIFHGRASDQ